MDQGLYLEIDTDENSEEYSKRIYDGFQTNMDLILNIIPDVGIPFEYLVAGSPDEVYQELSAYKELSDLMINYATSLKKSDMLLLAFMTDVAAHDGHAQGDITNMIKLSNEESLIHNFILVCILYMKLVFIPEVIKENLERKQNL